MRPRKPKQRLMRVVADVPPDLKHWVRIQAAEQSNARDTVVTQSDVLIEALQAHRKRLSRRKRRASDEPTDESTDDVKEERIRDAARRYAEHVASGSLGGAEYETAYAQAYREELARLKEEDTDD